MAIQDVAGQRRERQQLTECPLDWCSADLSGYVKTSDHFHDKHLPEHFGLTPLRRDSGNGGDV